ncbi:MAG: LemA family protein [Candidatus Geothermincolia bacterium]
MLIAIIVVVAFVVLLLVAFALLYNRLVRLRNKVDNAWHQIDVQLKRRYDLLPELARVVKGYAEHEKETFESVTRARSEAMSAATVASKGPAEDNLTGAAGNLIALVEKYPDLKANQEFLEYQKELATTEARIAGSRKYYNGSVMYYDNARQGFPGSMVAKMFPRSFTGRDYFEITKLEDREVPETSMQA